MQANLFKSNGFSHCYQLDRCISVSAASDLGMHCLPKTHKKDARVNGLESEFSSIILRNPLLVFQNVVCCAHLLGYRC